MCTGPDLFLCILAVLFPPIAVWIKRGICSCSSLINILLTMIGYLPGLLHAWYIVAAYPEPEYYEYEYEALEQGGRPREDSEGGVWIYVRDPRLARRALVNKTHGTQGGNGNGQRGREGERRHPGYGTTGTSAQGQQTGVTAQQPSRQSQPQAPRPAAPQQQPPAGNGEGSSNVQDGENPPPSYADVVAGDHKIQHD